MQTQVIKIDSAKNIDLAKIKEAADLVDAGKLVAFPTETVYGIACRVRTDSLSRLDKLKGRSPDKYYTLHIGQKEGYKKYLPMVGLRAQKLIKNAWPGPLTIVFEPDGRDIEKQRNSLEKEVFENLYKNNSIGIRCPDNAIASELLQMTHNAVVAPSANLSGQSPAVTAEQVFERFDGQIEMLLDGGPCKYQKSSGIVKIGKNRLEILRAGVYTEKDIKAMSEVKFLFVCTGNTCRSPMAKGIFSKYLAEKLGCRIDHLEEMGYKILSAGTMGITGMPATPEAVSACAAEGIDLSGHISAGLSRQLLEECDFVYAMSRVHCERIAALSPGSADKCVLLAENSDIADPIGQPQGVYNSCADIIEEAVKKRIGGLEI
jgi:protein-tyrosine phosphatase